MKFFLIHYPYNEPLDILYCNGKCFMTSTTKGFWLGLLSQILFGVLYLFSMWMAPLSGTDVFALRMLVMLTGILVIVISSVGLGSMFRFFRQKLGRDLKQWACMLVGTAIVGSQFWLFMWAPVNGEGVNVAMGYFLFPLVMVLAGRLLLKEELNRLQTAALILAALGVAHELWATHAFSWTTLWVCAIYPPYYLMRRAMGIPALYGLTLDLLLILPFALVWLLMQGHILPTIADETRYWLLLPALGIASAVSMSANLKASALLPVNVFGMLSYLEPALLFLLSVTLLGTPVNDSAYFTYGLIWTALGLLALNGLGSLRRSRLAAVG